MAGHTRHIVPYSNYNDFPTQEGGYAYRPDQHVNWYAYGPEQHVNRYVVETTVVERVRVPASGYTKFGGAPLRTYAPMDRHEDYEPLYGLDYENTSPPRHNEGENHMANFLNKLQIGARQPMKSSNNLSSPNKYRPKSPNKYRPTSPYKYHPTSPNKHRTESPSKYESRSPNKYRPTSPNKSRPKSPNKHRPTSPNKYRSSSPNKDRPTRPNKYRSSSPSNYRPASSTYTYPSKEATTMMGQTFPGPNKYRPISPSKYLSTSPTHNYPLEEEHMNRSRNMPNPNKHRASSPIYSIPSKEGQPNRTQGLSGPNWNHSSSLGPERGRVDASSPNYHWLSAGPPTTQHPLMTPTNNIDEALGFLMESVNYSPRSYTTQEGSFDNLSPRAQPTEHENRYPRTALGSVTNRPYSGSVTIDSHEAVRRYKGAFVPKMA